MADSYLTLFTILTICPLHEVVPSEVVGLVVRVVEVVEVVAVVVVVVVAVAVVEAVEAASLLHD